MLNSKQSSSSIQTKEVAMSIMLTNVAKLHSFSAIELQKHMENVAESIRLCLPLIRNTTHTKPLFVLGETISTALTGSKINENPKVTLGLISNAQAAIAFAEGTSIPICSELISMGIDIHVYQLRSFVLCDPKIAEDLVRFQFSQLADLLPELAALSSTIQPLCAVGFGQQVDESVIALLARTDPDILSKAMLQLAYLNRFSLSKPTQIKSLERAITNVSNIVALFEL